MDELSWGQRQRVVYGQPCRVEPDLETGTPMIILRAGAAVLTGRGSG